MARARRSANVVASSHASASPASAARKTSVGVDRGQGSRTAAGDRVAGRAGNGRSGSDVLEAADQAANTAPVRWIRADVADFAGEAVGAAQHAAVEHDAGRDSRANAQIGQVAGGASGAALRLLDPGCRGTRVVLHVARHADKSVSIAPSGSESPSCAAKVDRQADRAALRLDVAGQARRQRRPPGCAVAAESFHALADDLAQLRGRRVDRSEQPRGGGPCHWHQ